MTQSCLSNSDCEYNFSCSSNQVCVHDGLWPPNALDVITYIITPFLVGVANVGGIGGGIVKMPLLVLLLNYSPKEATFISYCLLFGGCVANSIILLFKKHPLKSRPMIDFNITLIINPAVLLGTNIGIFLNVILPELGAGLLFICFLLSISPYLFKKGMNLMKLKKLQEKIAGLDDTQSSGKQSNLIDNEKTYEEAARMSKQIEILENERASSFIHEEYAINEEQLELRRSSQRSKSQLYKSAFSDVEVNNVPHDELEQFYKQESRQIPLNKIILLVSVFWTVQLVVFLKGGKGLKSFVGITTCSTTYWLAFLSILIVAIIASGVIRFFIMKWHNHREQIIKKYHLEDEFSEEFDYTPIKKYLKVWVAGLGAGCLAGTFGAGAGLALVPLLLAEGVHPSVTAATCGFNYFFISSTTIISVLTNNYLSGYQILLFSILSFIGGFFIAQYIYKLVDRKKASHIIAFIVLGLAVLNIISYIIYLTRKGIKYGTSSLTDSPSFCSQ